MAKYLFTNVMAAHIFDEKGVVVKKSPLKGTEKVETVLRGEYTNEEANLLQKFDQEEVVVLNAKNSYNEFNNAKKPDFADASVLDAYRRILLSFRQPELFETFFDRAMSLTASALKNRPQQDSLIIQTINMIDDTDRILNTMSTRLREWYSLYHPELSRKITDHKTYAEAVLSQDRPDDSIGAPLAKTDLGPIKDLSKEVISLADLKAKHETYLETKIQEHCPNVAAVAGAQIAARLIALAGDLHRLVLFPSSTIQTLGAEKAMFRHLKTGDRPPKFGIIVLHPIVARTKKSDRGKAARAL
ncbi:MAG: hypothetical protein ACOC32_04000, partial [Nanoarchaeota archaeon]